MQCVAYLDVYSIEAPFKRSSRYLEHCCYGWVKGHLAAVRRLDGACSACVSCDPTLMCLFPNWPGLHSPPPTPCLTQLIWPGLFARHGGRLSYDFDLSTLAHLTEGYAAGGFVAGVISLSTCFVCSMALAPCQ
jgi:hypothetical protein